MSVVEFWRLFLESALLLACSLFRVVFRFVLSFSCWGLGFLSSILVIVKGAFCVYFLTAVGPSCARVSCLASGTVGSTVLSPADAPQPIVEL